MNINANGIDREATETEIAEIEAIRASAFDIEKNLNDRVKAKQVIAKKLGLTNDELLTLLS